MLNHLYTKTIETKRLILRKLTVNDSTSMFNNWGNNEEIARYMSWTKYKKLEDVEMHLKEWESEYKNQGVFYWGIEIKNTKELVGTIYLYTEGSVSCIGSVSYCVGKTWWGLGYATEALEAVINFGFNEVGYNRIEAFHAQSNQSSGRVMQKAGMKYEGTLRQRCKTHLGFEDCLFYSILKSDIDSQ